MLCTCAPVLLNHLIAPHTKRIFPLGVTGYLFFSPHVIYMITTPLIFTRHYLLCRFEDKEVLCFLCGLLSFRNNVNCHNSLDLLLSIHRLCSQVSTDFMSWLYPGILHAVTDYERLISLSLASLPLIFHSLLYRDQLQHELTGK